MLLGHLFLLTLSQAYLCETNHAMETSRQVDTW